MILYRTNDFDHENYSTNIRDVLFYEFFNKCNYDLLENIVNILSENSDTKLIEKNLSLAIDDYDKDRILRYVDMIIERLNKHYSKNFEVALWLYPLSNIQEYYEFQGIDPAIYGYNVSDFQLISYKNEGSLCLYENMPKKACVV